MASDHWGSRSAFPRNSSSLRTLSGNCLRVGYSVAPAELTRELRKVHQFNTFSIAHPIQVAISLYLAEKPESWQMS